MTHPNDHTTESTLRDDLSLAGIRRQRDMLPLVQRAVRSRRRRRRTINTLAAAAPLIAIAAIAQLRPTAAPPAQPSPIATIDPEPAVSRTIRFERVAYKPSTTTMINDDELLALLREAGRDIGLARRDGELLIIGDLAPANAQSPPADEAESESTQG